MDPESRKDDLLSDPVHQLLYRSRLKSGRVDSPLAMLRDIVKTSVANNARQDITGYLLFDGDHFLQILEGPDQAVRETYERIVKDPRHRDVEIMSESTVPERAFGAWAMGGHLRGSQDGDIFARHGAEGRDVQSLTAEQALPLAIDLAREAARRRSA